MFALLSVVCAIGISWAPTHNSSPLICGSVDSANLAPGLPLKQYYLWRGGSFPPSPMTYLERGMPLWNVSCDGVAERRENSGTLEWFRPFVGGEQYVARRWRKTHTFTIVKYEHTSPTSLLCFVCFLCEFNRRYLTCYFSYGSRTSGNSDWTTELWFHT